MRQKIDYGIDLGTTNSAIARMENGEALIYKSDDNQMDTTPSIVAFNKKQTLFVGLSAKNALDKEELDFPFVWKSAEGGYDGNGVKIVRSALDLYNLPEVECLAEALVPFKNELAVIVARNAKGDIKTYPVVVLLF